MKKNRMLSKIICLIMATFILIGTVSAAADQPPAMQNKEYDMLPVIYVSGFGATTLAEFDENGNAEPVFPPSIDGILDYLG
ncbi:MAG: hypothetical protein IJ261_04745, partial [Clostridia bacterium]|nr:hypothetical protein [Clostridia bacterium]